MCVAQRKSSLLLFSVLFVNMAKEVEMHFKIHSTFIYLSRLKFKSLCLSIPSAAIDDILNSQYNAVLVIVNCCLSKRRDSHVEEYKL